MTKVKVVALETEHIMRFVPQDSHQLSPNDLRKRLLIVNDDPEHSCLAVTLYDEVLAIMGAVYITECSMEFWAMPSVLVSKLKRKYAVAVKEACHVYMQNARAHRFVIAIREDNEQWKNGHNS
jgi:hypothetical protein